MFCALNIWSILEKVLCTDEKSVSFNFKTEGFLLFIWSIVRFFVELLVLAWVICPLINGGILKFSTVWLLER